MWESANLNLALRASPAVFSFWRARVLCDPRSENPDLGHPWISGGMRSGPPAERRHGCSGSFWIPQVPSDSEGTDSRIANPILNYNSSMIPSLISNPVPTPEEMAEILGLSPERVA